MARDNQEPNKAAEERDEAAEERRFIADLVTRGEAAEPDEAGHLPPGATHEIVKKSPDGVPTKVVRKRFAAS